MKKIQFSLKVKRQWTKKAFVRLDIWEPLPANPATIAGLVKLAGGTVDTSNGFHILFPLVGWKEAAERVGLIIK